ncbi:MAG: hypothetical protein HY904_13290 [Deltaproteobacteria bacterium]|nr:hypothetical protein [Deltaproteobacteria bacterium]
MGKLKAGKSVLSGRKVDPDGAGLCVLETHPERCRGWWLTMQVEARSMPDAPRAFWTTVSNNALVPVDPRNAGAILEDARSWPGWSDADPPLEVRTLSAAESHSMITRYERQGQGNIAAGLRAMLKRAPG